MSQSGVRDLRGVRLMDFLVNQTVVEIASLLLYIVSWDTIFPVKMADIQDRLARNATVFRTSKGKIVYTC